MVRWGLIWGRGLVLYVWVWYGGSDMVSQSRSNSNRLIHSHCRICVFPFRMSLQIFQPRKKKYNKTVAKQNDFEHDIFSSFKRAISNRRDFNLTKFSDAFLKFVFILPAWILFIFLCFPDFLVFTPYYTFTHFIYNLTWRKHKFLQTLMKYAWANCRAKRRLTRHSQRKSRVPFY